jgi:hypothetical protein
VTSQASAEQEGALLVALPLPSCGATRLRPPPTAFTPCSSTLAPALLMGRAPGGSFDVRGDGAGLWCLPCRRHYLCQAYRPPLPFSMPCKPLLPAPGLLTSASPPSRRVTWCPASVEAGSGWVVSSVALVLAVAPHLALHSCIFEMVPTTSLLFCACASEGPRRWACSSWACAPPAWGTH